MEKNEFNQLIEQITHGDDKALEAFIAEMDRYVGGRIKSILKSRGIASPNNYEDLMQAGRLGVFAALKNYNVGSDAKFTTYSNIYIDSEIHKALGYLSPTVRTRDPILVYSSSYNEKSPEEKKALDALAIIKLGASQKDGDLSAENRKKLLSDNKIETECNRFPKESLVLQIMEILKSATDERHPITVEQLKDCLTMLRIVKYNSSFIESPNTITSTMENILNELNPKEHTSENDGDYKIKYRGYDSDELIKKIKRAEGKHEITDFRYVQPFSYQELDELIQTISFSVYLSAEEKDNLIKKIFDTCGGYYSSPFWERRKSPDGKPQDHPDSHQPHVADQVHVQQLRF